MEHAALRGAPRLCGTGAVQPARLLARLRQGALPPGAMLPLSASLLLGSQAGHDAGGMGESRCGLPAAAGAAVDRIAEGFRGAVVVLKARRTSAFAKHIMLRLGPTMGFVTLRCE